MSQAANQVPVSGPHSLGDFATNYLNPALAALLSKYSGVTAPSTATVGQWWLNTSSSPYSLEMWDGTSWLPLCSIDPVAHTIGLAASMLTGAGLPANILSSSLTSLGIIAELKATQIDLSSHLLMSSVAPTILSGFGGGSISASNGTAAFKITVGSAAATGTIGLPTAANGWICFAVDITTNSTAVFVTKQTASGINSVTIGNFNDVAVSANWVAGDVLLCSCFAF